VGAARKQTSDLEARIEELGVRVEELESQLAAATKEAARTRDEMDREMRKARKHAEKAEADRDTAKEEVKALRADMRAAETTAQPGSETTATMKWSALQPSATIEPNRRARLSAPKGRFADDPETLTEWLTVPNVHLLVDGYNVTKAEGGFRDLPLESQRNRLLEESAKIARRYGIRATIVFDGSEIAPGTSRRARGPLEVEYSRPNETADDHLVAKLNALPKFPVVVVTNDRELQDRTARLGATIATSKQLLALFLR
jgi:predicted RNA-binding protein with PIN domain